MPLAVVCALSSSLLYALASVLQHRAAIAQPHEHSLRLGLLARLLRSPLWLIGIVCDALAYGLQFVALGHASLVLVQPLLVCGLLFALPLGAWLAGARMKSRDWSAALLIVAGLALFLSVASPRRGSSDVDSWLQLCLFTFAAVAVLIVLAQGRASRARAALLAGAAGLVYGLTAALTKSVAHLLGIGVGHLLGSWELYVLAAAGVGGMILAQSAFQAGPLDASLPVLTVVDPVVSITIGALAFSEGIRTGKVSSVLEIVGLAAMTCGVFLLSRAEAVQAMHDEVIEPL